MIYCEQSSDHCTTQVPSYYLATTKAAIMESFKEEDSA